MRMRGLSNPSGGQNVGCRIYNTTETILVQGIYTALSFDSERYDQGNLHSTVSNISQITFVIAGTYAIWGMVAWTGLNNANNRVTQIRLNGTTVLAVTQDFYTIAPSGETQQMVSTVAKFDVNDYVELVVFVGGAVDTIKVAANYSPEFAAQKIDKGG